MKSRIETAVQRFGDGCNCAQSVFTTFAPRYGMGESDALVHGLKCVGCVRDACRLLEEMLPARMAG